MQRALFITIIAWLAATGAMFVALTWFNHPAADDYDFANLVEARGIVSTVQDFWLHAGGRVTAYALIAGACALGPLDRWYPLWALGAMAATGLALFIFLRALLPWLNIPGRLAAGLTFWLLGLALSFLPQPLYAFYWLNSAVPYQGGIAWVLLSMAGLLAGLRPGTAWRRALCLTSAAVAAAMAVGSSELVALIAVAALGTAGVGLWPLARQSAGAWVALLVLMVALGVGTALAPGNAVRDARLAIELAGDPIARPHDLPYAVLASVRAAKYVLVAWLLHPGILAALLLWAHYLVERVSPPAWAERLAVARLGWWLVTGLAILVLAFFPTYWINGRNPPLRVTNVMFWYVLLTSFLMTTLAVFSLRRQRPAAELRIPPFLVVAAQVILIGSLVFHGNAVFAARDLAGPAPAYHAALQARLRLLATSGGPTSGLVRVPVLPAAPRLLFHMDISTNPAAWYNRQVALYYQVGSVALEP